MKNIVSLIPILAANINALYSVLTIKMKCEGCHYDWDSSEKVKERDLVVQVR